MEFLRQAFRYFFPKNKPAGKPYKKITLIEVDWEQVKIFQKFIDRGIVFREINHTKHGPRIYVYRGGTVGGGHIGVVKTYRPESFFDGITITGMRRNDNNLILLYE